MKYTGTAGLLRRRGASAKTLVQALKLARCVVEADGVEVVFGGNARDASQVWRSGSLRKLEPARAWKSSRPFVCSGSGGRSQLIAPFTNGQHTLGYARWSRRGGRAFDATEKRAAAVYAEHVRSLVEQLHRMEEQRALVSTDALTSLGNIRGMDARIDRALRHAHKTRQDLSLLFVDVDRLQNVNAVHGHNAGSRILKQIAVLIKENTEEAMPRYRFGGDEFIVLCTNTDAASAKRIGERIRKAVAGAGREQLSQPVTISVGVAALRSSIRSGGLRTPAALRDRLLFAAERALYRAKNAGRNRSRVAGKKDDRPT